MGRAGHVGVDTTVSTVSSTALLGGLVDLNVSDVQSLGVQVLKLGVALGILEKAEEVFSALLWPSSLSNTIDSGLCCSSNTTSESSERNATLVADDIFQILLGLSERKSSEGVGSLVSVLEVDTEV